MIWIFVNTLRILWFFKKLDSKTGFSFHHQINTTKIDSLKRPNKSSFAEFFDFGNMLYVRIVTNIPIVKYEM